jgi:flagellar FliL protein
MSNKLLLLIFSVLLVFMLGMGGGLFMMWNKLGELSVQSAANAGTNPSPGNNPEQPLGPICSLQTFIVNLADKGGNRYLRVTMDFELANAELQGEIDKRLPQIRDSILMILPSKRFEDISSVDGKIALRDEILEKVNSLLTLGKITNIYFKEFVVQ